MARLSLWNPTKTNDYNFIDRSVGEMMRIAGNGILVHMYEGPTTDSNGGTNTDLTTIQDVLFLENTSRKYNPNIMEMRGHYVPTDISYNLSPQGINLSSDIIRIQFHLNDMIDILGRRLIAGDVLEFPNLRTSPIFKDAEPINKYFVITDGVYAAPGFGPSWNPHVWLVRAKQLTAAPEFTDIINSAAQGGTAGGVGNSIGILPPDIADFADSNGNPGTGCNPNIKNSIDLTCKLLDLTDQTVAEAAKNVFFDPKFFESENLYVQLDENGYPQIGNWSYFSGDGIPPNGSPLKGAGVIFPPTLVDGDYYLRIDFYPERLYQKQGRCFKLIEENVLKVWTAYNRLLDTFVDNITDTTMPDGSVIPEKQALSQALSQKVDLYAEQKAKVTSDEAARQAIANSRARKRGY